MSVVHRNTPPARHSFAVGTPASALSSVFESPGSPGGRPDGKRDYTRLCGQTAAMDDLDFGSQSPLLEPELSLVPVDEATEDDELAALEEAEELAISNAALEVAEKAQMEVEYLRELLLRSNTQLEQLRSEVDRATTAPSDSPELRAQMARFVKAVIHPDAPDAQRTPKSGTAEPPPDLRRSSSPQQQTLAPDAVCQLTPSTVQDISGSAAAGDRAANLSLRAVSPSRPARKTPERLERQPCPQPSTNRSEHRGAKAQAQSARQHQRRIAAALSAGSSPKHTAAVEELMKATIESPLAQEVSQPWKPKLDLPMAQEVPQPWKPTCPFCGMLTLEGGYSQHYIACGQKDAAQRLHRLKFVIRPHLNMLKPADVWKRATELHFALQAWRKMHANIMKYSHPSGKERIRGGRDCILLSPTDLEDVVESILLTCPRGDALEFGLAVSYTSGPWVSGDARQSSSFCEVTRPPPDGSPAAEATDLEGLPAPVKGDPISGTKILRVEGTLVNGNLRSLLEHRGAEGGTMKLECCTTPSKAELVDSHKALKDLQPKLLGRSEAEQKSWLTDMICTIADRGSDFFFDYGRDPSVRAPCPLCCCTSEIGKPVELHSLTQLVTHYFRDHWHKGDCQDRRNPIPRGSLPARPLVAAATAKQDGSSHAPGKATQDESSHVPGLGVSQEAYAEHAEKTSILRTENGAQNPWARPQQQSSSHSHSAIRPNWNSIADDNGLEVKRKPRLARPAEAALFRSVQHDIVGADLADLFVCAVNMSSDGKQWSHDIVELFGCGPNDVDTDDALTSSAGQAKQTTGEATCAASTIGWTRSCKGRYRVWASSSGSMPEQAVSFSPAGFKVMLRCGDDRPVVYDGSWMMRHVMDEFLVFDFLLDAAPQLETGRYDQVAFPYKQLQVGDLWGVGRSAPAMVDLLMLQLDSHGDYVSSAHLDAKNTSTEWRRADSAGKPPDTSPWRLSGETVLSHSYWADQQNQNHRIEVNLDCIAPDIDSLVFIAKARSQLDGDEYTLSAQIEVPQIVLVAPMPQKTNGCPTQSDLLLGTYSCPAQNLRRFNGGDAVVMCRLYRKRATGSPSDAEWAHFESPLFKQRRAQRAPPSNRCSPALPSGGHMGEDGVVPMSPDQIDWYSDAPRSPAELSPRTTRTQSPPTQSVVGQQVQPGLQGNAVRTLVKTVRDPTYRKRSVVTRPHLSMRVGGGWASVPYSPRPGSASRSSTPSGSRSRPKKADQESQHLTRTPSPGRARETSVQSPDSQWFLQTIGLPLTTLGPNKAALQWDKLTDIHNSARPSGRSKARFREICDEMKGWQL